MAGSSADYERQIAETRGAMESKIVELRERTRDTVRRGRKALLIAAGVGAAVGAAAAAIVSRAFAQFQKRGKAA